MPEIGPRRQAARFAHLLRIGFAIALHRGRVLNQHFYQHIALDAGRYVVPVLIGLLVGVHQKLGTAQVVDHLFRRVKRALRCFGEAFRRIDKLNLQARRRYFLKVHPCYQLLYQWLPACAGSHHRFIARRPGPARFLRHQFFGPGCRNAASPAAGHAQNQTAAFQNTVLETLQKRVPSGRYRWRLHQCR